MCNSLYRFHFLVKMFHLSIFSFHTDSWRFLFHLFLLCSGIYVLLKGHIMCREHRASPLKKPDIVSLVKKLWLSTLECLFEHTVWNMCICPNYVCLSYKFWEHYTRKTLYLTSLMFRSEGKTGGNINREWERKREPVLQWVQTLHSPNYN